MASGERLGIYGPFYRLESPTQTPDDAALQVASNEAWGREARGGIRPQVKAFIGPLPAGRRGVEFYTDAAPDLNGHPIEARWSPPPYGNARLVADFATIPVRIARNAQSD
jgi:hypothetical protein